MNGYIRCGAHTHTGILIIKKKDEIMPFAATGIQLEIIILSEVRDRQISSTTYRWKLEKITQMSLFTKQK